MICNLLLMTKRLLVFFLVLFTSLFWAPHWKATAAKNNKKPVADKKNIQGQVKAAKRA
jgi:hypothetical protein